MKISRLKAQNFKSFDTVDVELGDFNVFIGANASGKSNFLSILTFLRDIAREGLEEAVSRGGGPGLIQNVQLKDSEFTEFEVWIDWSEAQSIRYVENQEFRVDTTHYRLKLRNEPNGFQIAKDKITSHLDPLNPGNQFPDEVEDTIVVGRENGRLNLEQGGKFLEYGGAATYDHSAIPKGLPLLATAFFPVAYFSESRDLVSFPVFNFHPSDVGTGSPVSGSSKLAEDGSNVALVLRNVLQNDEKRRKFLNLARALLPFVEDLDVDRFAGQSLLLKLQESHTGDDYLPASLLSDGTVKIVALLIALYFEDKPLIAFEEPATGLHPKLISQLMQMMKEVSEEKQIFVTTHNPEVIKHVRLENLYLVSRDENGFSQITKPSDSEIVYSFLENELGIDDLFVDDLLSL